MAVAATALCLTTATEIPTKLVEGTAEQIDAIDQRISMGERDRGTDDSTRRADTREDLRQVSKAEASEVTEEEKAQPAQTQTYEVYEVTAYTATCAGCTGVTYSGYDVRNTIYAPSGARIIAVDPSVIPLGSTVEMTLGNGAKITAVASDIGSAIKGKRIDLLMATEAKALEFGRQSVEVRIISEN